MTMQILQPLLDRQRSSWRILSLFGETPKDELSFWRRFAEIDASDREFLAAFYNKQTPRGTFIRICLFWDVPMEHGADEARQDA